jgi:diaminohydroxyphosphoribosylaminopyrimidine deaminase / 5-amino-6-(5-phosphoribosylamino)uracil reductase
MDDAQYMRRAIGLAMRGRGAVEPNPMVGCVIVKEGRVIGEGFHERFGGPHAEPNALGACTESPQGATAYVTLEPCCHTNKKTPPCVPRLIEAKLGRVVVGAIDPNPDVAGRGVAALGAAGIEVAVGVLEKQCQQLAAPFLARTLYRRLYVTLKWAQTADGFVAGPGRRGLVNGKRLPISNADSMLQVHRLRAASDAILVGANTIAADDPKLTARGVATSRPLLRAGLASRSGLFLHDKLQSSVSEGPVILYCTHENAERHADVIHRLAERFGVIVQPVGAAKGGLVDLVGVLTDLYARDVTHLLVEPGPTLAASFFETNLADRVWVFRSPEPLNQRGRVAAPVPSHFKPVHCTDLGGDTLTEYLNARSPVFFAPEPSADMLRAANRL